MLRPHRKKLSHRGFTLPEVLVAVAMVGILSAVVLPSVIGQVNKGEISRIVQDLQSVEQASQMFRTDIGAWPATLQQLVTDSTVTGASLDGTSFSTNAATIWRGPYLSRGNVAATGLATSLDGKIGDLTTKKWGGTSGGSDFVVLTVAGLDTTTMRQIDEAVDGEKGSDVDDSAAGKIRYETVTPTTGNLFYYTSPLK